MFLVLKSVVGNFTGINLDMAVLDKPVSCVDAVIVNPLLVDFTRLY
jgi:hypothetical protein